MDLSDVRTLRALLERHGVPARKGLGQHFLISKPVVQRIVERISGSAGVFEIGPGPGVLTSLMSETVDRVLALEVDPRMAEVLAESAPKAEIVQGDALEVDYAPLLDRLPTPRAVVSNLPYYITGPLLTRIAEAKVRYGKVVLMMQKEVGTRVLAPAGSSDRGSLSVFIQALFEIEKVADVPPGSFWPPPKVESVVLELVPRDANYPNGFFELVRSAFRQPRKTLANNLVAAGVSRPRAERALMMAGLNARARPSDPNLEQWVAVYANLGGSG